MPRKTATRLPVRLSPRPLRAAVARIPADDRAFILGCILFAVLGLLVLWYTRAAYVTWTGVHEIPTELPSCGDYCGTDAGLLPPDAGR